MSVGLGQQRPDHRGDQRFGAPSWRTFLAAVLAVVLLAACGERRLATVAAQSSPLPTLTAKAVALSSVGPAATATPVAALATATPRAMAVAPATPTAQPTTAQATVDPAQAYLVAGNTHLRAGDAVAAVHDYGIARLLNPQRSDIVSALATAEARLRPGFAAGSSGPPATPTPVASLPARLLIPAIGVNAPVESVGITADGSMDVPKRWQDVAWFQEGPAPGQPGNATIAGHLDSTTGPAVFWRLGALESGAKILVVLANEQTVPFVVRSTARYPYNAAPLARIFGSSAATNLNLITCGGSWDLFKKNYSERIVVFASKA